MQGNVSYLLLLFIWFVPTGAVLFLVKKLHLGTPIYNIGTSRYTKEEFLSVAVKVCPKLSEEMAIIIGEEVWKAKGDVHDIISASTMKTIVFQIQLFQGRLKSQLIIKIVVLALLTTVVIIAIPSVSGMATSSGVSNMTFVGNMTGGRSMMMPGGNMTFGTSLQNAKMHLTEAIMDLKSGNTKGAMMELNLTDQGIKIHEQEIKSMMMEVKGMTAHMKGNTTSSSKVSKNATR
jgi:hypothetical protein